MVDGGKGIGRSIEAIAGTLSLANSVAFVGGAMLAGSTAPIWLGVGAAAAGATAIIDACN